MGLVLADGDIEGLMLTLGESEGTALEEGLALALGLVLALGDGVAVVVGLVVTLGVADEDA